MQRLLGQEPVVALSLVMKFQGRQYVKVMRETTKEASSWWVYGVILQETGKKSTVRTILRYLINFQPKAVNYLF
jgi:hypothetical protein